MQKLLKHIRKKHPDQLRSNAKWEIEEFFYEDLGLKEIAALNSYLETEIIFKSLPHRKTKRKVKYRLKNN